MSVRFADGGLEHKHCCRIRGVVFGVVSSLCPDDGHHGIAVW